MRHTAPGSASPWFTATALLLSLGCVGVAGDGDGVDSTRQNSTGVVLPPPSSSRGASGSGNGGDSPASSTAGTPATYPPAPGTPPDGGVDTGEGCTLTQGYWKNHSSKWPVSALMLGSTSYDRGQLLAIFNRPTEGNGLVSLAHQLIAAKLNLGAGASSAGIADTVAQADALIGALVVPPHGMGYLDPGVTSALNDALTAFNEGRVGPGHCDDGPPPPPGNGYPPGDPVPPAPTATPYPPTSDPPSPPPIVE